MNNSINSTKPFQSLLGPNGQQLSALNGSLNTSTSQRHVLTLSSSSNPAVFSFDNIYENVTSIEVIKTRIERSEHTCEYYRNTPFVVLTNDCESLLLFDNAKFLQFQTELSVDPTLFFNLLQNNIDNTSFLLQRSFFYNYTLSSSLTEPMSGMCPFVLKSINYTISTLINALNTINTLYQNVDTYVPSITTLYNSTLNMLYFESNEMFSIIPSNAFSVVGLRADTIYVSQLNQATNKFTVYADFPPKLDGPDVVYFENDESYPTSFKNTDYISLTTVYLPNTSYPILNTNSTDLVFRPLQLIQKLPKLTLTLYTDLSHSFLYQTNGKMWYIDLIINGKV